MIINRSNTCPKCGPNHSNECYIIYDNGSYCYSCGYANKRDKDFFAYNNSESEIINPHIKTHGCPNYYTDPTVFSKKALLWLSKYYIYSDIIKKYKIGYCEPTISKPDSLLFFTEDQLDFQRRFLDKTFYSSPNLKKHLNIIDNFPESSTLIIVEDYISAIRCAEFVPTLCVFGTHIADDKCKELVARQFTNVVIWLDGDDPGIKAGGKLEKKLNDEVIKFQKKFYFASIINMKIKTLKTTRQPKEYTNCELLEIIENV